MKLGRNVVLTSFKKQLIQLAEDSDRRFHLEIRKRIGKRATPLYEEKIKQLIVHTPDRLTRIYELWNTKKSSGDLSRIAGFILAYVYNPKDFLSCDDYGLFGYLDDAYLVILVYEQVLWGAQIQGIKIKESEHELLESIGDVRALVKVLIPKEAQQIESMLEELIQGRDEQYLSSFGAPSKK
jgi:uncharacterized membrane protein YkvA (DUF1232 family)